MNHYKKLWWVKIILFYRSDQCHVKKIFNGKHISAMLEFGGDLLVFSDRDEEMRQMFPDLTCFTTTISKDRTTNRLSAIVNIGCEIVDCVISKNHILLIDCLGRLWSLGRNRNGQLGLCTRSDQSKEKRVQCRYFWTYIFMQQNSLSLDYVFYV